VSSDENEYISGIEKLLGIKLKKEIMTDFEPSKETPENEKPQPKKQHQPRRPKAKRFGKPNNRNNAKADKTISGGNNQGRKDSPKRESSTPKKTTDGKQRRANKDFSGEMTETKKPQKKQNNQNSNKKEQDFVQKHRKKNNDDAPMKW
jgi:hypothetical protein